MIFILFALENNNNQNLIIFGQILTTVMLKIKKYGLRVLIWPLIDIDLQFICLRKQQSKFDHFWANSNYGNAKNREIRSSWSSCNLIKTFKICFDMFLVEKMKKVKKKRKMSKSLTLPRYLGFKPQLLEQNCPPKIWILKGD